MAKPRRDEQIGDIGKVSKQTFAPPGPLPEPGKTIDPGSQYISGPAFAGPTVLNAYWGLPVAIDDAEQLFGDDIYDRMLHDPDIGGIMTALKSIIIRDGFAVLPRYVRPNLALKDEGENYDDAYEKWEKSFVFSQFVTRCLERLSIEDQPFSSTLWDMMEALTHGHRVAEVTMKKQMDGEDAGKIVFESIAVKPRGSYKFVIDSVNRVYGVTAVIPGQSVFARQGVIYDLDSLAGFVPKAKLWIYSFHPRNRDPRGTSVLRSAYTPWRKDIMIHPEDVKFMAQVAGARTMASIGSSASGGTLPDGSFEPDPKTYMMKMLSLLANGGVFVTDNGNDVSFYQPTANGEAFEKFFSRNLQSKARAILGSTRSFIEAQHGSKADASQSDDLLGDLVTAIRSELCASFRKVVRYLLMLNFPNEDVDAFCPRVTMIKSDDDHFSRNSDAAQKIFSSGLVTMPMRREIAETKLGLTWIDDDGSQAAEEDISSPSSG